MGVGMEWPVSLAEVYQEQLRLRCACVRLDAMDCAEVRAGHDLAMMLDPDLAGYDRDDGCACVCHEADGCDENGDPEL
jgi:hypothetical protein